MNPNPSLPLSQSVLAIHGGAGTLLQSQMSEAQTQRYSAALEDILRHGRDMLAAGASALDVVTEAVRRLEECELFNAGKGAVYTAEATHELDASVMCGHTRRAGAVAGVSRTRNPVLLARAVMEQTSQVMLMGEKADALAARLGLEQVDAAWFGTEARLAQLRAVQARSAGVVLDHDGETTAAQGGPLDERSKFGTVGAVALDAQGRLAAATSTGGMTNKPCGRVGDTPVIGAGCFADDGVAVSCTGTGEAFIRACVAHDVAARVRYLGQALETATHEIIHGTLTAIGGDGGLIAVSASGAVSLPFNTEGMYRGFARVGGEPEVGIFRAG